MSSFSIEVQGKKFDTEADIRPYLEKLDQLENIREVNFTGNSYGKGACEALAKSLASKKDLEVANLSDIFTGRIRSEIPDSLDDILVALLNCPKLHTIDLSDNAFGIATIDPLESFLAKHSPLEHLLLSNNGFGPLAGSRVANALEKLAEVKKANGSPTLKTVLCGRNRLENGSMEAWASFLAAHGSIQEIRLYQNGIRQEGLEHLFLNGLAKSPELEKLDLQDNTLTERGARALSKVFHNWKKLKELGISDCLLSARGGEIFAQTIVDGEELPNLEILKLQYNEIESNGINLLSEAIAKKLPNLKTLEINGNRFSEDHEAVDSITKIFEDRGFGEIDELDDMEELTDDEDEEEDENESGFEDIVKDAEEEEEENVAPEKSDEVDDLAAKIEKTTI
ncbi:Rna1p [Sugiyamaella lignohabitans]|uniref:Rna1p n=1 Tax=Sugiyamaella lignohabitans TaxID=796027 RepID=A0A167DYZ7_9ASCO|nr:Rna1p [Sugiyamaella lignohabitans]ANB13460.1 Rna1p [Sugiyamaella lignohabitans]